VIPWITLADVWQLRSGTTDVISATKEKISEAGLAGSAAVRHPAGTVILSRTASVGFSAIMGLDMATSQDFATWTCGPSLTPRYLLYALRATAPDLKRVAAGSTHQTIYMPDIEQLRVPLPPVDEQRRIAEFLDAEISYIDRIVTRRSRQVEILEERERAAAFHAVRGSNFPGPRRPSGFGWLGSVPEGWTIAAVSHQYEVLLGKMLNEGRASGNYLRPYLRNTNVQWDSVDTSNLLAMNFPPEEMRRYRVEVGDLLICEGGEPGRAAIWDGSVEEIYYQKALHRVRPRSYSSARWLYYCMRAATAQDVFAVEGNVTTIAHLTGEQLRRHRFPFPERTIQDRIVRELDASAELGSRLAERLNGQLELLAERRQALITAAVTGQIDVTTARGVDVA
jgi:type I restriction enzyme S subunit